MEEEIKLISTLLPSDKYVIQSKINEGSYGEIFKIKHRTEGTSFALKVMEIEKLERMKKGHEAALEVMILQKVKHPGVVRLYDFLRSNQYMGLVMELCPNGDLFKLMHTVNKKIDLVLKKRKIMVYYLAQVLEAVDYLHSKGVIHRDLKPENIVLGPNYKIRIVDFGTAKVLPESSFFTPEEHKQAKQFREEEMESRKSFVGTTNYLSPESIDLDYSFKSDIWALGILAYKFYFNKLPFEGADGVEILKKIKHGQLPLDPNTDPDFKQFFDLTLAHDPQARPSTTELKKAKLFQGVNFQQIFQTPAPIGSEELGGGGQETKQKMGGILFEMEVEKRMFFGNYKPRILTISKVGSQLMMAYRYVVSREVKNQFQLNMNDYAEVLKSNEFQVVTTGNRYRFRMLKGPPEKPVKQINEVIRNNYKLS